MNNFIIESTLYHEIGHHVHRHAFGQDPDQEKEAEDYSDRIMAHSSHLLFRVDPWLAAAVRPRVRERTFDDYVDKLDRYIRPLLGGQKLFELRPLDIQKAYAELQASPLAPRTTRYAHSILASALKRAVLWHILPRNPCDVVELPRQVRREMRALAPDEAARFLEAAREIASAYCSLSRSRRGCAPKSI